jgi:branched-chain amino acid transport system substrate-binding protein
VCRKRIRSAFQKLTDIDGVKIILGGLCSSETLAMSPLANEKKVLLLSPMSSNPKIEDEGPFTMSLSYSDKMTGEQLAKAVSGFKKVAMISEQNDYNVGVHDSFAAALKAYPTAVFVSDETFPKNASDFRGTLAKVKATSPDVLVLNPNPGTTATNLLKQLAEMKTWTGYKLYGQIAYIGDASRTAVGKFAEGMTIIDVPTINSADFKTISDAIVAQSGTLNDIGSYYVASTLDDLDLLTSEITKLGNDATKVQQDLSTGSFNGFVGPISFGGNNFFKFTTPGVYIVQDGKAVLQ